MSPSEEGKWLFGGLPQPLDFGPSQGLGPLEPENQKKLEKTKKPIPPSPENQKKLEKTKKTKNQSPRDYQPPSP